MWRRIKLEIGVALEVWAKCIGVVALVAGIVWLIGQAVIHGPWAWMADNWVKLLAGLGVICGAFLPYHLPRALSRIVLQAVSWTFVFCAFTVAGVFSAMFVSCMPLIVVLAFVFLAELRARGKGSYSL